MCIPRFMTLAQADQILGSGDYWCIENPYNRSLWKILQLHIENAWPQVLDYYLTNYITLDRLNLSVPPQ